MISAVLDSNIFISAFLFNGNQRRIINHAIEGDFRVNISHEILSEIDSVLKRPKFKLTFNQISLFLNEISSLSEICYPSGKIIDSCRDSDDHIILECSVDGVNFSKMATIDKTWGRVGGYSNYRMETFSTVPSHKGYEPRINFSPVKARYVKIYATECKYCSLSEVQLLGY